MANPLKSFFGITELEAEKSRLEAFLAAFPGQYCGFSNASIVAYSQSFPEMLGLKAITDFADIQQGLRPGDDAALESCFRRLQNQGTKFSMKVRSSDGGSIFRISGSKGRDLQGAENYDILWLEDVSDHENDIEKAKDQKEKSLHQVKISQAALDVLDHPVWMRDQRGQIIWCNRFYAEILNTTPEEIVNIQKDLNFTKKPDARSMAEMSQDGLSQGVKQTAKRHLIIAGDRRLFEVVINPVPHLDITIGEARDITREEEYERETSRNAAANRELLEHLNTPIGLYNAEYRLEFYNSAYAQIWQMEEQWLDTKPKMTDIIERLREMRLLPEQADYRQYKINLIDTFSKMTTPYEEVQYLPDGRTFRMIAMPRPHGGVMLTFEDVTSRLELESSYNTLIAVQKETLDNLAEGVAAFGGDGRLKLWNPSFARLWDMNPEDMDGSPHITRLVERWKTFFDAAIWQKAKENLLSHALERSVREGTITRANGTILEYAAVPLPDGGMLITHSDITDTIRVENALREKTNALETAERLKLEFLANVSYQLRTPLNAIIGFTEILDKEYFGALNERQKEYTKGLGEAGERLMNLINDILDLSSIEAGYMTLEKRGVSVCSILQDLVNLTQEWARSQRIEVELSCDENLGLISADERRMKQVLLNLIRNAIEFTPPGGRITLSGEKDGDETLIKVTDTGLGIPEEDQERVFKPFEKTDAAKDTSDANNRGGAGLGLSLVRNIVELHGGTINLDSKINEGTTVTIRLP